MCRRGDGCARSYDHKLSTSFTRAGNSRAPTNRDAGAYACSNRYAGATKRDAGS